MAEEEITLDTGFHAIAGSEFKASIESCAPAPFTQPTTAKIQNANVGIAEFLKVAPNPFKNSTTIHYQLSKEVQQVNLAIYDRTGKLIMHPIQNQLQMKGLHQQTLPAATLLPGMYFVILHTGDSTYSQKIILVD